RLPVARRSAVALARHVLSRRLGVARPGNRHQGGIVVWLIVYYVVFMIAGDLAAYIIGLITEREFGGRASLMVFLARYLLILWVSRVLAVWMTEPKHVEPASTKSV